MTTTNIPRMAGSRQKYVVVKPENVGIEEKCYELVVAGPSSRNTIVEGQGMRGVEHRKGCIWHWRDQYWGYREHALIRWMYHLVVTVGGLVRWLGMQDGELGEDDLWANASAYIGLEDN
ncbi:hypothetical protein EDC04DRAFT_2610978 [Pisolithus marmoratus]|nr:hypothetical protein EDC04DRAFT_2610978 [Pisolithus marmoratus]